MSKGVSKLTPKPGRRGRSSVAIFSRRRRSRFALTILSTLLVAVALLLWQARVHAPWPPFTFIKGQVPLTINACAPLGDHKEVSLPDRSTVQLNSGTCVSGVFTPKLRLLRLETGEGIFQVARDPNRPFIVETGRVSIADVGTRFDVYRRDAVGTRVAVLEGAIQIYPRGSMSRHNGTPLVAGQQIDIPNDTGTASLVRHITPHDVERMTAWLDGLIQFEGQPLGTILAEFARYQRITFITADPFILSVPMGGTFRTTDVDSFVGALKLQCIRGKYNETHQNITLTRITGCR